MKSFLKKNPPAFSSSAGRNGGARPGIGAGMSAGMAAGIGGGINCETGSLAISGLGGSKITCGGGAGISTSGPAPGI